MVNAEKWGVKIKSRGDVNLLLPNFCVLPTLSFNLSVFSKLCIMNTLFIFSFCYVSHAVVSGTYPPVAISQA